MTVKQPDLSFTQNPQWISEREEHWKPIEDFLKENNRKKVVDQLKNIFFTGVIVNPEDIKEGFAILYYPLQTAEAWDYLFQDTRLAPKCFKDYMSAPLMGSYNDKFFWEAGARLRFFDYFHPATYQPVIKSRVPIGREQKVVEIELDVYELFGSMCSKLSQFVNDGNPTILTQRLEYFFSTLDNIGDLEHPDGRKRSKISRIIYRLLQSYFIYEPEIKAGDVLEQKAFLTRFYNHIANNPVHPSIKAIWQKVVDEHE